MAELTPLDEKLGEVLGSRRRPRTRPKQVSGMEDAEDFEEQLERIAPRPRRPSSARMGLVDVDGQEDGDPREGPRDEVRGRRHDEDLPRGEDEALDGFEFLAMAEAGELCHWESCRRSPTRSRSTTSPSSPTGPSSCSVDT